MNLNDLEKMMINRVLDAIVTSAMKDDIEKVVMVKTDHETGKKIEATLTGEAAKVWSDLYHQGLRIVMKEYIERSEMPPMIDWEVEELDGIQSDTGAGETNSELVDAGSVSESN